MTTASAIVQVRGRALALPQTDIDTDRIMPARFLKAVTFAGIERHVFADDRTAAAGWGGVHPFDEPDAAGARILVTGANFGCGSSREHAPQALLRWGLRAIVAESFSPIFAGNALAIGLVCVAARPEVINTLVERLDGGTTDEYIVDLQASVIRCGGLRWPLVLTAAHQHAWLSGAWDATGLLLARYSEVERVEARLPYLRATSSHA